MVTENISIIRDELHAWRRKWQKICADTGICQKTLRRLYAGDCVKPHKTTLRVLSEYFESKKNASASIVGAPEKAAAPEKAV